MNATSLTDVILDIEKCKTFLMYGGIGDHIYWLSVLPEYRKTCWEPVVVICDPRMASLVKLYEGRSYDQYFSLAGTREKAPNTPSLPIVAWHGHYKELCSELEAVKNNNSSIITVIQTILGVPTDSEVIKPLATEGQKRSAAKKFDELELTQGKTVFLAPYSRTSPTMPKAWWLELVRFFNANCIQVVCNKSLSARGYDLEPIEAKDLDGAINIEFGENLGDVLPVAELCGTFIGPASGIAVMLARSGIKNKYALHIYHDNPRENYDKDGVWSINRAFPGCGVNEMDMDFKSAVDEVYWMQVVERIKHGP